jgi:hypothetical protein
MGERKGGRAPSDSCAKAAAPLQKLKPSPAITKRGANLRPYPLPPNLAYHPPTSSAKGSLREAFVEAGRGAALAGLVRNQALGRRRVSARDQYESLPGAG